MEIDINGELNRTDKLFIAAYIRNKCNGTRAQKEVEPEMSDEVAASAASQRLKKVKVKLAIEKKLQDIADIAEIDAVWALKKRMEIVERSMRAEPVLDYEGQPTGEYKYDAPGANAALNAIEKVHLSMTEKQEIDAHTTVIIRNFGDKGVDDN